ncbi:MAG: polysaccharide biosynthesis tyrosine autokinase [Oscillatoriophycideae cyanobacterium NC_groundwater_1537_Pr4_S-0.65um_50_18]|nr:polysaccharide biosynthesis tyrosine autokinase [Oscillatoriophycideae cyanobacterium NC_groundwater_1537_Pr4_S-0.65um_50_18]
METEQTSQALSPKRSRLPIQLPQAETEDMDNPPNKGLNLRSLGRTIQRQSLLIAGVATVVAGAAALNAINIPPSYEGDFQLLVEPVTNAARSVDPVTVTRADGAVPGRDTFTLDYSTQLQILQSPQQLDAITQEVQKKYPDFSYEELRAGLSVERLVSEDSPDPTKIIQITYQGDDPVRVQTVLQVTADRYLQYSLEDRKTSYSQGIKFIDDQLPEIQQRVSKIQDGLQQLQQQYDIIDPATQGGQISGQIEDISAQQLDSQRELREQRTLYDSLQRQLQLSPSEALAASVVSQDPNYQATLATMQELEGQLAIERARFNDSSPVVASLLERKKNLETLRDQQIGVILRQNLPGGSQDRVTPYQNAIRLGLIEQLVTAANQIQILEVRNQEINRFRGDAERKLQQFPAVARRYADLTRELEIATQTLNRLQTQRETLRVEAAQTETPWEIISRPSIPRNADGTPQPVPSKASNLIIAGAGLGLLLGTLLALFREKSRNVFYTVEDVQEGMQMPLIGIIPFSRGAKQSLDFPVGFDTVREEESRLETASFREAFSDLYSNIRLAEPPIRSLMVCSAQEGDGKTTIALYLAQTAAGANQKVLLVDTNMRSPQIHTRLNLQNKEGLSDLLTSNRNPDDLKLVTLSENLFVLPAGPSVSGAARLLGSDRMQFIMEQFQSKYDLVIYDTSHLFGLTDASFLTTHVDEILMVIAAGKTNRTAVERVINKLIALRAPGVNLVTNYLREYNSPTNTYGSYTPAISQSRGEG